MTDEQIFEKLETTYETEGGRKFIGHLLRSFFPVGKSDFMWEKREKLARCCLTGDPLVSRNEVFEAIRDTTPEEFSEHLRYSIDPENKEAVEHPTRKKLGAKILGIECKGSDKLLCKQAYDQLYNFYASKLLSGDGHMNWLAKRMMAAEGLKSAKKRGIMITDKEEKAVTKRINKPRKTATFGDLQALQDLKAKFEAEEKKAK